MRIGLILASLLSLAGPAAAQDASVGDDWDLIQQPERRLTMAATTFDNGVAIAARCLDGSYDVVLAGLPPAEGPMRRLRVGLNDAEPHDESWSVTDNPTVSLSDFPLYFSRQLREGGQLNVIVPGENGQPNRRYVLDLPASAGAIDAALTACRKPLTDTRSAITPWVPEDGSIVGLTWAQRPRPTYPQRAQERGIAAGRAVISCVVQAEGRVGDCIVESEHPAGYDFGEESIRAAERARIVSPTHPDEARAAIGRRISFPVAYRLAR